MTRQVTVGAACWALSIAFFVDQAIVQAAWTRPYSLATNFISDLGSTMCGPSPVAGHHADVCSPLHGLMNGTFIAVGLLHLLGAVLTRDAWPRRPASAAGLVLLAVAGAGLVVVGLAPEDVNLGLHTLGALVGLVCLNAAMILLGLAVVRAERWFGVLALVVGIAGLVGLILFTSSAGGLPVGTTERVADYPAAAMVVVFGVYLLASAVRSGVRD
jgi:hypothetical membrane protein